MAALFPPELIKALGGTPRPAHDGRPPPDLASAYSVEKGHGRIETRRIMVSSECVVHLDWPGATQICRIERTRQQGDRISRDVAYSITSLTPGRAGPDHLMAPWRDHWRIENTLHWRRDVVLREDQSRIRSAASPQAMAALRNTLFRLIKPCNKPLGELRQAFSENRQDAIQTVIRGLL